MPIFYEIFLICLQKIINRITIGMQPSKCSFISSYKHQANICTVEVDPNQEGERSERYLEFIRITLRNHLKDRVFLFQEQELKQMLKLTKLVQQANSKQTERTQNALSVLKAQYQRDREVQDARLEAVRTEMQEELLAQQSDYNHRILAASTEFSRKEQEYKQVIERVMNSLANSQKIYQSNVAKLSSQMQSFQIYLQKMLEDRQLNQTLQRGIREIVEEIELRQQNSVISSKQDDMSLDGIQLSAREESGLSSVGGSLQSQLQNWIVKLICFGLLHKDNQECLRRMMGYTANYEHPAQLLQEKVFPVMMEVLINNMRKHQGYAMKYLNGTAGEQEENSRVQLRNINNISDLSINDSNSEQHFMNFKRKEVA